MDLKKQIQELKSSMSKSLKKVRVFKTESHNTITFVALEPGVVDNNGDIATKDEVVKAAHYFMLDLQNKTVNVNHQENTDINKDEARFVESYILPMDLIFDDGVIAAGTWMLAIKFSDDLFQKVIDGEIVGISIEGLYDKEKIV